MRIPHTPMTEQMEPILHAVDLLLFTEPKAPRENWRADIDPLMEQVKDMVGTDDMLFVYQIATNQALRTALDPRFRKATQRHRNRESG